jgi:hypothetical protein
VVRGGNGANLRRFQISTIARRGSAQVEHGHRRRRFGAGHIDHQDAHEAETHEEQGHEGDAPNFFTDGL